MAFDSIDGRIPVVNFNGVHVYWDPPPQSSVGSSGVHDKTFFAPRTARVVAEEAWAFQLANPTIPVLLECKPYLLVDLGDLAANPSALVEGEYDLVDIDTLPLVGGVPTIRNAWLSAVPIEVGPRPSSMNAEIRAALESTTAINLKAVVEQLCTSESRHWLSSGYMAALQTAHLAFETIGFNSKPRSFEATDVTGWNLVASHPLSTRLQPTVATAPGDHLADARPADTDTIVVCAHLDSVNKTNKTPQARAPGARDNASGCATLLELARLYASFLDAGARVRSHVEFVLFGGEEFKQLGSNAYVGRLSGTTSHIRAVLNLDITGPPLVQDVSFPGVNLKNLYFGTNSEALALSLASRSLQYDGRLTFARLPSDQVSSDHKPFEAHGIPAVLVVEGAGLFPGDIHSVYDIPGRIDFDGHARITRVCAAWLLHEVFDVPTLPPWPGGT